MFSEILKIVPKIDEKDLKKMQASLQGRFTKLAKGFGKGLVGALKGGGIAGIAIGLIDKLLNPLKEVQDAIERTLQTAGDLADYAEQFNTSTGKLFKLVTLAKAAGLDQQGLYTLIGKFQSAVADASANPNDPNNSSVRNYVGAKDMSEAFFGFITQLQKMDKNSQILVQKQVFGEKQILKMAAFLQQDFATLGKRTGLTNVRSERLSGSINKLDKIGELKDILEAGRGVRDIQAKAQVINNGMVRNMDKSAQIELERENQKIKSYNDLAALSQTTNNILFKIEEGVALLGKLVAWAMPTMNNGIRLFEKMLKAPIFRGVKGLFGGEKDK